MRQLAGLPGLLARVDTTVLDDAPADEPVPGRAADEPRARGTPLAVAAGSCWSEVRPPRPWWPCSRSPSPACSTTGHRSQARPPAAVPAGQEMTTIGDAPVHAKLALEPVTWGTRLQLACTYAPETAGYDGPPRVTYTIVVRTRDGHTEQVGTWRSLEGRTMQLTAATASNRKDIAAVEVRTADGRPVLESTS